MAHASTEEPISIRLDEPAPGTAVLRVEGEVDMLTSPSLRRAIGDQLNAGKRCLVVDLNGVQFLGTSGLAALVEARATARSSGTELWLACDTRQVLRPLQIAGLADLFQIGDSTATILTAS